MANINNAATTKKDVIVDFTVDRLWRFLRAFGNRIHLRFCADGRVKVFMSNGDGGMVLYIPRPDLQGCRFSTQKRNLSPTMRYVIYGLDHLIKSPDRTDSVTAVQLTMTLTEQMLDGTEVPDESKLREQRLAEFSIWEMPSGEAISIASRARVVGKIFAEDPKQHPFYTWWYQQRCVESAQLVSLKAVDNYVSDIIHHRLPEIDAEFTLLNPDVSQYVNDEPPKPVTSAEDDMENRMKTELSSAYGTMVGGSVNYVAKDPVPAQPTQKKTLYARLKNVCNGGVPTMMSSDGTTMFMAMRVLESGTVKGHPSVVYYAWSDLTRRWTRLLFAVTDENPDGTFTFDGELTAEEFYEKFPNLKPIYGSVIK